MSSFVSDCRAKALELLEEAERATEEFAARTKIKCREGCGQCCLKPGIEVQVVEMLPLANALLEASEADIWYDKAASDPEGRCVFYAADPKDQTLGRCQKYELRPSLCRLFGFAAVSTKDSKHPALAACFWHKRLQPDAVAAAQKSIDAGESVPLFADFRMRMFALAPTPSYSEIMPINRALMLAIEKVELLARQKIED